MEIAYKWIKAGYSAVKVLKILKLNKSTYYYNIHTRNNSIQDENIARNKGGRPTPGFSFDKKGYRICDDQIKEYILEILETEGCEFYGYYKITITLKNEYHLIINKKKVYRLCKELDILRSQRKTKPKHPRK